MLVDASIWIDVFSANPSRRQDLEIAIHDHPIVIGDLILVEFLQGIRDEPRLRLAEATLRGFAGVTLCGAEIAPIAAENYRALRRVGITVRGTIDVIIATWCIQNKEVLFHNDRDFLPLEKYLGLKAWR